MVLPPSEGRRERSILAPDTGRRRATFEYVRVHYESANVKLNGFGVDIDSVGVTHTKGSRVST
jgi:hypothetical protein